MDPAHLAPPADPPPVAAPVDRAGLLDRERELGAEFRARYAPEVEGVVVRREVPDPIVTLIVVSYKAQEYLLECLQHLAGQTVRGAVPYEILVADSGGLEHLRSRYGRTVDVELRLRPGLPLNVARNAAMGWARGELVAYIDDDGLVSPTWVEEALRLFEDPAVGCARGRILPKEHPYFNTYAVHYDRGGEIWEDESLAVEGNMMVRRLVYLEVGGFPDAYYGGEGARFVHAMKRRFPHLAAAYAPGMAMRHDYCRSMREFVWKCRRYRTKRAVTTAGDPDYGAFLAAYMRKPKPHPERTAAEELAYRALKAAEWVIVKLPVLDRVERR